MAKIKHGMVGTSEYNCWKSIKRRCTKPNATDYHHYGGRGIKMCDRWLNSFDDFLADMGRKPTPKHSIERINNDGNYEPSNCRWATQREQVSNSRHCNKLTHDGKTMTIAQWSQETGIPAPTISSRIHLMKWSVADALATKSRHYTKV